MTSHYENLESSKKMGSRIIGSSLLIAGCCIGAGMLGMPVISGPYGFLPTLAMFLIGFTYMVTSGTVLSDLLIEEKKKGASHVHLLSLSEAILGKSGKIVTWILFGFLFYAVLTAYTIGTAKLIKEIIEHVFPAVHLSLNVYALCSVLATVGILINGTRIVDYINRWCLLGLISVYLVILVMASTEIEIHRLERSLWNFSVCTTLPVIAFSFGYHNLLPTIASYLNFNTRAIRRAIVFGAGIPFIVYTIWELVIFGIVPFESAGDWTRFIQSGDMITHVLSESIGVSRFTDMAELFALFAIITSYITVGMSMTDFLRDGLDRLSRREQSQGRGKEEALLSLHTTKRHRSVFVLLSLLPPLAIGVSYPSLFLTALSYSGGVIAMLLFGILPALCRWVRPSPYALKSSFGNIREKCVIFFLLFGGLFIMAMEIGQRL